MIPKDEIDSHSSALTNRRIDAILTMVTDAGIGVSMSYPVPTQQHATAYFGALVELYLATHSIFQLGVNSEMGKKIDELLLQGKELDTILRYGNPLQKDVEDLINTSRQLYFFMHEGLQNIGYFFRIGTKQERGIEHGMKLFEDKRWKRKVTPPSTS